MIFLLITTVVLLFLNVHQYRKREEDASIISDMNDLNEELFQQAKDLQSSLIATLSDNYEVESRVRDEQIEYFHNLILMHPETAETFTLQELEIIGEL